MNKAIFPGSFNPLHSGHISIIKKASKIFDFVYVVICNNPEKPKKTSLEERYNFALTIIPNIKNIKLITNEDKLTITIANELNCKYLIRSARNDKDFNYELELAAANHSLNNELETILIIPDYKNINYQSRLIKQTKNIK